MNTYILTRTSSNDHGTFGFLSTDGSDMLCVTGEPAWRNNGSDSCIPVGTYLCEPHNSPAHPHTWEVTGVPNRTAILIHTGNAPEEDSLGCILVGTEFGTIDGLPAVLHSQDAIAKLRQELPANFRLEVKEDLA